MREADFAKGDIVDAEENRVRPAGGW